MAQFNNRFEGDNYGDIHQAGGDMFIVHGASSEEALDATGDLRATLDRVGLAPEARRAAEDELDSMERELRKPQPESTKVAYRLNRVTEILKSAGAFASAGAALFGPIGVIAGFLGPLGEAIAEMARD